MLAGVQRWLMGEAVGGKQAPQYNPYLQYAFKLLGIQPYKIIASQERKILMPTGLSTLFSLLA